MSLPRALLLLAATCALLPREGAAVFCVPDAVHYRYVGDVASDTQCTDNDIQSAIDNVSCPNTIIVLTGEHTYTAQHLDIGNKDLTLTATTLNCGPPGACGDACPPPPTSPIITISGSGHSGDSVLYIHGNSHVTLRYLEIRDGSNFDGPAATYGGGIHFDGTGSLTLDTTTVDNNAAMFGGGIAFTGSGGFAGLTLGPRSLIVNNSAGASGGGIRVDGDGYLSILQDDSVVYLNHAPNGDGGGVHVIGPAHADIGSPGLGGLGVVSGNDAQRGGGIAVSAGDHSGADAEVQLFTLDAQRPVRVSDNFASIRGGGIYLHPYQDAGANFLRARLCAAEFRIAGNVAPEGGGVYADNDTVLGFIDWGSEVWLNRNTYSSGIGNGCAGFPPAATRCAPGVACNEVADNVARDAANQPTAGAAIYLADESTLRADRVAIRRNSGGYALHSNTTPNPQELSNCLVADNTVTQQLIRTEADALQIGSCTIAGNTIQSTDTIHAEGPFTLVDSLVYQPGNQTLAYSGAAQDRVVKYVLASEAGTLGSGEGVASVGAPGFVDAAHGDYRLALASPAIDYAPHVTGNDHDLDGNAHDRDLPSRTNFYGALDLGAYERQPACAGFDTVYCDGFETN